MKVYPFEIHKIFLIGKKTYIISHGNSCGNIELVTDSDENQSVVFNVESPVWGAFIGNENGVLTITSDTECTLNFTLFRPGDQYSSSYLNTYVQFDKTYTGVTGLQCYAFVNSYITKRNLVFRSASGDSCDLPYEVHSSNGLEYDSSTSANFVSIDSTGSLLVMILDGLSTCYLDVLQFYSGSSSLEGVFHAIAHEITENSTVFIDSDFVSSNTTSEKSVTTVTSGAVSSTLIDFYKPLDIVLLCITSVFIVAIIVVIFLLGNYKRRKESILIAEELQTPLKS